MKEKDHKISTKQLIITFFIAKFIVPLVGSRKQTTLRKLEFFTFWDPTKKEGTHNHYKTRSILKAIFPIFPIFPFFLNSFTLILVTK